MAEERAGERTKDPALTRAQAEAKVVPEQRNGFPASLINVSGNYFYKVISFL